MNDLIESAKGIVVGAALLFIMFLAAREGAGEHALLSAGLAFYLGIRMKMKHGE